MASISLTYNKCIDTAATVIAVKASSENARLLVCARNKNAKRGSERAREGGAAAAVYCKQPLPSHKPLLPLPLSLCYQAFERDQIYEAAQPGFFGLSVREARTEERETYAVVVACTFV